MVSMARSSTRHPMAKKTQEARIRPMVFHTSRTIITKDQVLKTLLQTEIEPHTTMTIDLLNYLSPYHATFLVSLGGNNGTSYRGIVFNKRIEMDTKSTIDASLGNMNVNDHFVTLSTLDTKQPLVLTILQFPRS